MLWFLCILCELIRRMCRFHRLLNFDALMRDPLRPVRASASPVASARMRADSKGEGWPSPPRVASVFVASMVCRVQQPSRAVKRLCSASIVELQLRPRSLPRLGRRYEDAQQGFSSLSGACGVCECLRECWHCFYSLRDSMHPSSSPL